MDLLLIKLNSSGFKEWMKTIGGIDFDYGWSVVQTIDEGYVVAGHTNSFGAGSFDLFLVKIDSSGSLEWAKTVGGTEYDVGISVIQTIEEGYIVTGVTNSFGAGLNDLFLVKFRSTGSLEWAKTVGGIDFDGGASVIQTIDGGYAVTGGTEGFLPVFEDLFLVKFSSSGSLEWAKVVSGTIFERGRSIVQTTDGGYIVVGGVGNLFLVKFDSDGNSCIGSEAFPTVMDITPSVNSVLPTVTIPSVSIWRVSHAVSDTIPNVNVICTDISEPQSKPISFELTVSPNPFNSSCAITTPACATVGIYDLQGRLVWNKPSDSDNVGATSLIKGGKPEEVTFNNGESEQSEQGVSASVQRVIIWQRNETISSGVYLVQATTNEGQQITKHIVYLK